MATPAMSALIRRQKLYGKLHYVTIAELRKREQVLKVGLVAQQTSADRASMPHQSSAKPWRALMGSAHTLSL